VPIDAAVYADGGGGTTCARALDAIKHDASNVVIAVRNIRRIIASSRSAACSKKACRDLLADREAAFPTAGKPPSFRARTCGTSAALERGMTRLASPLALVLLVVALVVAPAAAHAQSAELEAPRTTRSHATHQARDIGLIAGGIGMIAGGWIANMLVGSLGGWHDGNDCSLDFAGGCMRTPSVFDPAWSDFRTDSAIPLVGPILQATVRPAGDDLWPVWLTIDEILQIGGLALLIAGAALMPGDSAPSTPSLAVMPMLSPSTVGLTVGGTF
jgi:hypothetical protein